MVFVYRALETADAVVGSVKGIAWMKRSAGGSNDVVGCFDRVV